ncbi:MAG TPA: S1C family serine protease [Sphingobium sp.]
MQLDTADFDEVFKDELDKLNYNVVSQTRGMFEDGDDHRAEFLIGGTIKSMTVDVCFPHSGLGDVTSSKGAALMEVEWQIYNRLDRQVVESLTTRTGFEQSRMQAGGFEGIIYSAFAENVRALAASGKLLKFVVGAPVDLKVARSPTGAFQTLHMTLPTRSVGDLQAVVGATVLVQSGDGHGSGFLISQDGYFLTNQHVVGAGKFVKLRWSDGVEGLGEVVRVDRVRDVALIKGDARGRAPIRIRAATLDIGQDVYAVGAPLEKQLQNSVTKGVLSAKRIIDGYSLLQSDVSVVPGNSGGPMVDSGGDLVGLTVSGLRINDAPQGINFFIPAPEAFQFLGIMGQ